MSVPATVALRPLLGASFRERALLTNVTNLELEEGQVAVAVKITPLVITAAQAV